MLYFNLHHKYMPYVCMSFIIFLGLCFCFACIKYSESMNDPNLRSEIESRIHLKFPRRISWNGVHLDRGMDYYFVTAFQSSLSDIDNTFAFAQSDWSFKQRYLKSSDHNVKWFNPDAVERFKSFEKKYPNNHSVLKVLVDITDNKNTSVTVYLLWFELS